MEKYTDINARTIDKWNDEGWEWGVPVTHEQFLMAKAGEWKILLTPQRSCRGSGCPLRSAA